jgi:RimJ/RimL family protein N-acetyltransferase
MDGGALEAVPTGRLELLPLRLEHAAELAAALSDPALHTFIGGAPATPDELRSRCLRLIAGSPDPAVHWWNWVLRLREDGCLVGTVQATVSASSHDSASHDSASHGSADDGAVAEVAWVVGTPWQGRGIATEAAGGLIAWLGRRPVRAVIAHVHPEHRASAAVAAAVGLLRTDRWHDGEVEWRLEIGG